MRVEVRITPVGYRLLTRIAAPAAMGYLLMRSRKQPEYRGFWGERFGWSAYPAKGARPRVWLHAVSVGETNAARPLVAAILKAWPEAEILLTHMTPTGRDAGRRLMALAPERFKQCYLPYDMPGAVSRFFREARPDLGVIMETEIWPNLMAEAERRGVPVVLANARESEKSRRQAEKAIEVMRPAVRRFSEILAQTKTDEENFKALGAERVTIVGSLKFDIRPDEGQVAAAHVWKAVIMRPVLLAASTREGEEAKLLEAFMAKRAEFAASRVLLLLVPRHPQRFAEVRSLFEEAGVKVQARSALKGPQELAPETEVLLGDTMGEMSFYCGLADLAAMGGSFMNYGCQNLIEPCAQGVPVILGPSTFNFKEAAENAAALGAAESVKDFPEAMDRALRLFADPAALARLSEGAKRFAGAYTGATRAIMQHLEPLWKKQTAGEFPMS